MGGAIALLALNVAVTASMSQLVSDQSTPSPVETETETTSTLPPSREGGAYEPAPDFVLALRSDGSAADRPEDPAGKLDALGLSADALKRYANFRGAEAWNINVWSGESRYGMTCLLVAVADQPISGGGRAAEGCSLKGDDTIADITGANSLTRLVLRGDHVDVYVYEPGADPNAP